MNTETKTADAVRTVHAEPTKEFFIYMITRDIELPRAILDLVDNCVDGATVLRGQGSFAGLKVRIDATPQNFSISDNCGGIPATVARNYAFRFGRPAGSTTVTHSIGQFGVGMKRALFKLGTRFRVFSTTADSRFLISVDVMEWLKEANRWEFQFQELDETAGKFADEPRSTRIDVTALNGPVSDAFKQDTFIKRLQIAIAQAHQDALSRGLSIQINGVVLETYRLALLAADELKPVFRSTVFEREGRPRVVVRLYAGIAASKPEEAGWYVFCNGRLVLGADQTLRTGWGEEGGALIPKYHNQFARFRGYVFFDSDDAELLPWNTTKTGVDADSSIFQAVRLEMIVVMRPIIDFLNELARETAADDDEPSAAEVIESSASIELGAVAAQAVFVAPQVRSTKKPTQVGRIVYTRPIEKVERAQQRLGVRTRREVGEQTFEYYYALECAE